MFAVAAWRETPYFSDAERAALALTEALTRLADSTEPVPDAIWDAVAEHFDEEQLGALVLDIGQINLWNRLERRDPAGGRRARRVNARAMVSGWLTSVVKRPASDVDSCASPSWRMIDSWSK